jgi:hypothetical protein
MRGCAGSSYGDDIRSQALQLQQSTLLTVTMLD